jgi:hypothetical protein
MRAKSARFRKRPLQVHEQYSGARVTLKNDCDVVAALAVFPVWFAFFD